MANKKQFVEFMTLLLNSPQWADEAITAVKARQRIDMLDAERKKTSRKAKRRRRAIRKTQASVPGVVTQCTKQSNPVGQTEGA